MNYNNVTPGGSPLDLGALRAMMSAMPRAPIIGSHSLFPNDSATRWKDGAQEYVIAGPGFWKLLPVHADGLSNTSYGGLRIEDMDAKHNEALWRQVTESLARVMAGATAGVTPL